MTIPIEEKGKSLLSYDNPTFLVFTILCIPAPESGSSGI